MNQSANGSQTMPQVDLLIEGYARQEAGTWYASPATVLIRDNDHLIIVDPGANKKLLLEALGERNVKLEAIDIVFITHYHLDHIFNLRLFPNAILCDGEAFIDDEKMDGYSGTIPGTRVDVVATPGHDAHHWSLIVDTTDGKIAVAGDLFWWQQHEEQKIGYQELLHKVDAFVKDEAQLKASRETLLDTADVIIPGHGKMFRVPEREA